MNSESEIVFVEAPEKTGGVGGWARVPAAALVGGEAVPISVEADVGRGLPRTAVVGLGDRAVRESLERVRAALVRCGWAWPVRRITVNLAPAGVAKVGSAFDLPIALAILAAAGEMEAGREIVGRWLALGEVGLDGALRPAPGGFAAGILARRMELRLLGPPETATEAARVEGCRAYAARDLREAVEILLGKETSVRPVAGAPLVVGSAAEVDLAQVRGQPPARRAIEIAAAGGHNILLCGPPGSGKTLLARALPGLLPPPSAGEAEEIARIASSRGDPIPDPITRPFRAPHATASVEAVIGGGPRAAPGEITRAHRGVLLLDEIAEFRSDLLESLRGPLESGEVVVARAAGVARLPARFLLVATMNPCRCGYWGDMEMPCRCPPNDAARYQIRLSGPLRDRLDLSIFVRRPAPEEILGPAGESSAVVGTRVATAREVLARDGVAREPDAQGRALLVSSARRHGFSARAVARVQSVARTIAALAGRDRPGENEMAEAVGLRFLEIFSQSPNAD